MDVYSDARFLEEEDGGGDEDKSNRLSDYKSRSIICDQESRRCQLLRDQKRRREETFNAFRNITELYSEGEKEGELESDPETEEEFIEWTDPKPKFPKLKDVLMFSEWMVKLPEDLEEKWLFMPCPVGKRCLVHSAKGCTSVYGKRGQRLARFQSALPNGSQRDFARTRYSNSEVTILDCIWNSQLKTYFILDLLSWKGQLYMDTEASFRGFWIKSKVEEMPWVSQRSEKNLFPFVPLDCYPCGAATISSIMSKYPYFPSDEPKLDGVLFYHSEGYYTPGFTPLVVWLKPFMLPEMLGVGVSEAYIQARPASYVDINHFIASYEEGKRKRRERRPRRYKKWNQGDEDVEEENVEVEMIEE